MPDIYSEVYKLFGEVMIEVRELRIGNLAILAHASNAPIVTIVEIMQDQIGVCQNDKRVFYVPKELLLPIELNEDWLLKMDFIKISDDINDPWFDFDSILPFTIISRDGWLANADWPSDMELKYIHQLQNLYFALTGKELEIKI